MKIGFIGYGNMAKALAGKWAGRHHIMVSGRNADRGGVVAYALGVHMGTVAEAVAFGDVVVLAVPHQSICDAITTAGGAEAFAGKVVIDISNPVQSETFMLAKPEGGSITNAIAETLPKARVCKAFNMAQPRVWANPNMWYNNNKEIAIYTSDEWADEVIEELIIDIGAEPVRLGTNSFAYQLEAMGAVIQQLRAKGMNRQSILEMIWPDRRSAR